jgi:hypothetical protein
VNIVDNLYNKSPQEPASNSAVFFFNDVRGSAAWLSANDWSWRKPGEDQRAMVSVGAQYLRDEEKAQTKRDVNKCLLDRPIPTPPITCVPAKQLPGALLPNVGAIPYDPVDARLVREFGTGTGDRGARSRKNTSPIPEPVSGKPLADRDYDGMPDEWEKAHGLDPTDAKDAAADPDGDGYTNIETFLNRSVR